MDAQAATPGSAGFGGFAAIVIFACAGFAAAIIFACTSSAAAIIFAEAGSAVRANSTVGKLKLTILHAMGAWDIKNFGNDETLDWVDEFIENPTIVFLNETIETIFENDYLEADVVMAALGAIEIIAAAKGQPSSDFPDDEIDEELIADLARRLSVQLTDTCKRAIERIVNQKDNELYELWRDADQLESWIGVQLDLLKRVSFFQLRAV